ncbi:H-2 class II histocompatibility antigen, I-E alpha chain-like [Clarias gariepinus]|uniref:H-2 class II histocompatibility antigen, I-E alpha chain-like n=1 Tax=Clarias gariepinus TaxID=13013 RepID=UPI00234C2558|nr:H-2 class II histocompatibility antigen, I-E alpha chain-like [Clarias gariepinus]
MKLLLIFFTLSSIKDISAQIQHVDLSLSGCSSGSAKEYVAELDGEEILHTDFKRQILVNKLPDFAEPFERTCAYKHSVLEQKICKLNLDLAVKVYKNPSEALDIPQNSIYSKSNVELEAQNTLVCHSGSFFPPPVRITWTRNGVNVTDESTLSQFYPNKDNTYNQFSHLHFTPKEGDVYTCTVEHKALETPDTKTWEVDVELPSVGPAVFCGVGLAVGLLGVVTGTFFLIKGNRCN